MTILVTGGAGFIGSHFIRHVLATYPDDRVVNLDKLTYAGNLDNLRDVEERIEGEHRSAPRYVFAQGDIADGEFVAELIQRERVDAIVNFAAESHVDRSLRDARPFIETNVLGVEVLLSAARRAGVKTFVQVSTDEVYGSLVEGYATETSVLNPASPYSASKAAGEHLCSAHRHTYGMDVRITRGSNTFGPYQYPEKFIPRVVTRMLAQEPAPIYGYGLNIRTWLAAADHARAIDLVLRQGEPGEIYNVGGAVEKANIEVALTVAYLLGKPPQLIEFVEDRPGHDFRYGVDGTKIQRELGWLPTRSFDEELRETVRWYVENRWWWQKIVGEGKVEYL